MPKTVVQQIVHLQRRFFWAKAVGGRGGHLVRWDLIKKPKDQGGLGVGDICMKNASLLFKWRWRFADSQMALWKEVIQSIHNCNYLGEPHEERQRSHVSIWGQITDFKSFGREIQEVAKNGMQIKVGNGAQTRFWHDWWTGKDTLKNLFPRLFSLSNQKDKLIVDMGTWEEGKWEWHLKWRRKLFIWEDELLGNLYLAVNRIKLRENTRDGRVWSFHKSSIFSVSNFVLQVNQNLKDADPRASQGRLAWRNLVPPRVQLHVWFVLQGKLNTKERLFRIGIAGIEDDRCIFCNEEPESLEHIIFSCRISSQLWYYCCDRWNISICLPKDPMACFLSWLGTPLQKGDKKTWISMFYIISWSIWNIRNKMIFQKFEPNWEAEKRRPFLQLTLWNSSGCPNLPHNTDVDRSSARLQVLE